MYFKLRIVAAIAGLLFPTSAGFSGQAITKSMSFEACLETVRQMATTLGITPTNIVETSILRMVRLPAADGSVLVTCSKPDQKMVLQPTSKVCGVDVEC